MMVEGNSELHTINLFRDCYHLNQGDGGFQSLSSDCEASWRLALAHKVLSTRSWILYAAKKNLREEPVERNRSCQLDDMDVDMDRNKEELNFIPSAVGNSAAWHEL